LPCKTKRHSEEHKVFSHKVKFWFKKFISGAMLKTMLKIIHLNNQEIQPENYLMVLALTEFKFKNPR
jgi:hypothetical protein